MPRFVVPVETLPGPNEEGDHIFRFRVVSEDRNSSSEYSNLFILKSLGQIYPYNSPVIVDLNSSSTVLTMTWETPSIYNTGASAVGASVLHNHGTEWKVHDADIFVKWLYSAASASASYTYLGVARENHFNYPIPSGAASAIVIGQVAHYSSNIGTKQPKDIFTIFSKTIKII